MQPTPAEHAGHHDHPAATGTAADVHGRALTTTPGAAAWYQQAQRAIDSRRAAAALRLAVRADRGFGLAVADLAAITGTPDNEAGRRSMTWERHHIEVVRTAAAGNAGRAVDLLREHLASVGCDPLAFRIVARFRPPVNDDDVEGLAVQLPDCHAAQWPAGNPPDGPGHPVVH